MGTSLPRDLYVAPFPTGSDLEGNGTQRYPFASVDRARALRQSSGWNTAMTEDGYIRVAPGTYYGTNVTFGASDSGTNGFYVRVVPSSGSPGDCKLLGGVAIPDSSWSVFSGSVYRALIPVNYTPWTIYEGGVRAIRGRTPKLSVAVNYPTAYAPYFRTTTAAANNSQTIMGYDPGDVDPTAFDLSITRIRVWSDVQGGETDWFTDTATPVSVDGTAHTITVDNPDGLGVKFAFRSDPGGLARYFIEGDLSLVTDPGEFTVKGAYIYYVSRAGGAPTGVVMPTSKRAVSFVGTDASTRTTHVQLDSFEVGCTDFDSWYRFALLSLTTQDYIPYQYQFATFQQGAVYFENADTIDIPKTHVKNAGQFGIFLQGYAQGITGANCWVEHTGNDGVYANGPDPGSGDILKGNSFTNIIVNNFGELTGNSMGIHLNQSGSNVIGPGEIFYGPRNGVGLTGWVNVSPTSGMYTQGNVTQGLRIHDVDQDSSDCGAYLNEFMSRVTGANTTKNCSINGAYASTAMSGGIVPNGVFNDNQTDGQIFQNVMVTNVQGTNPARNNDAGTGPQVTNCSFNANGTVNGSFDPSLIDFTQIGVSSANPYRAASRFPTFSDSFETGLGNWTTAAGTPAISTAQAQTGTHSYHQVASGESIYRYLGRRVYGVVTLWLYDPMTSVDAMGRADEMAYSSPGGHGDFSVPGNNANFRAMGIDPTNSTGFYAYWVDNLQHVSTVARSLGWHQLTWDYSTGGLCTMKIDGTTVATPVGAYACSQVAMGDYYNQSRTGLVYWDSVSVVEP